MGIWNTVTLDVRVDVDDFHAADEKMKEAGGGHIAVWVAAEVDLDEALEEATPDQLREALGREEPGYTNEQLEAIRDCFAAVAAGDAHTAAALLGRIFDHTAQIVAAERGMAVCQLRQAA